MKNIKGNSGALLAKKIDESGLSAEERENTPSPPALPKENPSLPTGTSLEKVKTSKRKSVGGGKGRRFLEKITGKPNEISNSANSEEQIAEGQLHARKEDYATNLLISALELLGIQDNNLAEIATKVTQLAKASNINGDHFTSNEIDIYKQIKSKTETMFTYYETHRSAIKIQSLFRAWRVQKKIRPILSRIFSSSFDKHSSNIHFFRLI